MDQMACATGGLVFIDFEDTENPVVKKQVYDFSKENIHITAAKKTAKNFRYFFIHIFHLRINPL